MLGQLRHEATTNTMSSLLPSIEAFARVSAYNHYSSRKDAKRWIGNGCHRRRVIYRRCVSCHGIITFHSLMLTAHPVPFLLDHSGFGLLFFGQNYLIYPSSYPPGSRTGASCTFTYSTTLDLLVGCRGTCTDGL